MLRRRLLSSARRHTFYRKEEWANNTLIKSEKIGS
jgi:hypothetical protein